MQNRLGVAAWLCAAFEYQLTGRLEGNGAVEVLGHGHVVRVVGVLTIHHFRHALHGFQYLLFAADTVVQPVGHMLAGNPQGRAVFHQAHILDVRHLGATHTTINPAHHVTQHALRVVIQLLLNFLGGQLAGQQRNGKDVVQGRTGAAGQLFLNLSHVDFMVVGHVQRGGSRRRHPGTVGTSFRVTGLIGHHLRHFVGHGPHAFTDLGVTFQAAFQANVHVPVFVGADPRQGFHFTLGCHGARFHGGVHFITGAIQEAGVDEDDTLLGLTDTLLQVHSGATLFIHNANFQGVSSQT